LRQIQCPDEESMVRQLDCSGLPGAVPAGYDQTTCGNPLLVSRVQAKITQELLRCFLFSPINFADDGARQEFNFLLLADQRTGQFVDDQDGCFRRGFLVLCVPDAQNIACILYQSMLKSASSRKKRSILFSSPSYRLQRAIHTAVRTSGRTPQTIVTV
jgi:hypothetical protein